MFQAIRAVHDGQTFVPPELGAKLVERLSHAELTPREQEVAAPDGVGQEAIRKSDATLYIAEGTVKVHVANILGKMRVNDRTQAVTEALRRGMVRF